jgi:hypothetical protein
MGAPLLSSEKGKLTVNINTLADALLEITALQYQVEQAQQQQRLLEKERLDSWSDYTALKREFIDKQSPSGNIRHEGYEGAITNLKQLLEWEESKSRGLYIAQKENALAYSVLLDKYHKAIGGSFPEYNLDAADVEMMHVMLAQLKAQELKIEALTRYLDDAINDLNLEMSKRAYGDARYSELAKQFVEYTKGAAALVAGVQGWLSAMLEFSNSSAEHSPLLILSRWVTNLAHKSVPEYRLNENGKPEVYDDIPF